MKMVLDTHCHTIASGHAYSTLHDLVREAKNNKIKMFALTEHGPSMPGGPHIFQINNQRVIPRIIDGVFVLRGVEANIIDYKGNIDIGEKTLRELDIVLASLHDVCISQGSKEQHTNAIINAMKNQYVDIICHPGNPYFDIDMEKVVKAAKENNVLIEINNSSFGKSRVGSKARCIEIAKLCKELNVKVVAGSDTHIAFDIGKFNSVIEVFNDINMPEELVMNTSISKMIDYLESKGKKNINEIRVLMEE